MANSSFDLRRIVKTARSLPAASIRFSRRKLIILLAIGLISPCLIVAMDPIYSTVFQTSNKALTSPTDEPSQISEGKPGPWGRLQYTNFSIDLPDEYVSFPPLDQPPARWFFGDCSKQQVIELLKSADITQSQIDTWLPETAWQFEPKGTWVTASDELILGLSSEARSKIYSMLISFPENNKWIEPIWFRPETLDKQLSESGLKQSSIKLLKSLLYRNGSSLLLFVDKDTALRQITDDEEKRLFIKTISRKPTLIARLKIDADADVEALADYWSVGGRRKDILPLISSVQRIKGGWDLSVVLLLPNFIRDHLYNYPNRSTDPQAVKQDCFWTALNALNLEIDDRFSDLEYARQILLTDYYRVSEPSQLGDLVFLTTSDNQAKHAAIYLADDIVFTKNGLHYTQPWILMHLKDMVETYTAFLPPDKQLKVIYCRKKTL